MKQTMLIIDDEEIVLESCRRIFSDEGFHVETTKSPEEGLRLVSKSAYDVILCDWKMPGFDGLDVVEELNHRSPNSTVVMISGFPTVSRATEAMKRGAMDYVSKPFRPRELVARVMAVLRRGTWDDSRPRERVVAGKVVVDAARHEVLVEGTRVPFTATEFAILHYLACNPGRVFTRNQLLSRATGTDSTVIDRNVDVHVGAIRRKLGEQRDLIETVRGVGYRFQDV